MYIRDKFELLTFVPQVTDFNNPTTMKLKEAMRKMKANWGCYEEGNAASGPCKGTLQWAHVKRKVKEFEVKDKIFASVVKGTTKAKRKREALARCDLFFSEASKCGILCASHHRKYDASKISLHANPHAFLCYHKEDLLKFKKFYMKNCVYEP